MNNYDYNFDYVSDTYDIQTEKTFGFNVGLIGNFRISDYFDLRFEPGLVMSNRNLLYNPLSFNQTEFLENIHKREIKSTYIHFPLILKVSAETFKINGKCIYVDFISLLCIFSRNSVWLKLNGL